MNDVETKKRNKLADNTLNSVTVIRSSFKDKEISCVEFKVTQSHLDLHNQNIYKDI
ncbi:protein FAM200B-like, partial [Aphis craccivora]